MTDPAVTTPTKSGKRPVSRAKRSPDPMPGLRIIGTGHHVPGRPYTNHDLSRVLDTNDEWIRQRTGIGQRYFCPPGLGVSDLALPAAQRALEAAGKKPEDLDYILFNTM